MFDAKIITDSISSAGCRLTTMQITHPRIVHAELLRHRMFSFCAASSRAIPFAKMLQQVQDDPFIPLHWGVNEKGMQANKELTGTDRLLAIDIWMQARDQAIQSARRLADPDIFNIHKQIVNRLLEPWMWTTVAVTGDEGAWSNFFTLRCHPAAEPHIRKQAELARSAYFLSQPMFIEDGDVHLPYVDAVELATFRQLYNLEDIIKISVGRVARTSYTQQEGKRDPAADIALHDRLLTSRPLHASPAEHVCQSMGDKERYACYTGWKSYRHTLKDEYVTKYVNTES